MDSARTYTSVSKEATYSGKVTTATFFGALDNSFTGSRLKDSLNNIEIKSQEESTSDPEKAKDSFESILDKMKAQSSNNISKLRLESDFRNRLIEQCITYLLQLLLGKGLDNSISTNQTSLTNHELNMSSGSSEFSIGAISTESTYINYYQEQEETTFSTSGKVVAQDGREISFNLDLSMSRSFTSYYKESITATTGFIDPLVINFDSIPAEVSDVKISFDLDSDGEDDQINLLSSSSGYLAYDINEDGIINDGSELFGTKSGDGFKDLSKYDLDGNNWIDENDEIFNKLKICVMNEDGSQTLYKLSDKGIGALYLGSADTEFSLNDVSTNETYAKIRQTGIFLYESGDVGTMQHLDLAQ